MLLVVQHGDHDLYLTDVVGVYRTRYCFVEYGRGAGSFLLCSEFCYQSVFDCDGDFSNGIYSVNGGNIRSESVIVHVCVCTCT